MTKSKSGSWILDDAEIQRRKRVASYKSYTVEDRFKSSSVKAFVGSKTNVQTFAMDYGEKKQKKICSDNQ